MGIDDLVPVPEAQLKKTDAGLIPQGAGWFVLNARETSWVRSEERGQDTDFEGGQEWTQLGFRIHVLMPGQRNGMYHREGAQEDFLVVSGECVLVIEGEERRLRAWDFVHCPPWTHHVFVGAGGGPCVIVMTGSRAGACARRHRRRTRPTPASGRRRGRRTRRAGCPSSPNPVRGAKPSQRASVHA
jgi:mannose-6-phosphate isomerase-like protein (cupin superfamily)